MELKYVIVLLAFTLLFSGCSSSNKPLTWKDFSSQQQEELERVGCSEETASKVLETFCSEYNLCSVDTVMNSIKNFTKTEKLDDAVSSATFFNGAIGHTISYETVENIKCAKGSSAGATYDSKTCVLDYENIKKFSNEETSDLMPEVDSKLTLDYGYVISGTYNYCEAYNYMVSFSNEDYIAIPCLK